MLNVGDIVDVQGMKFWYKFVNKSLFGTIFTLNNELYQIETRGHNQLHLFPTRSISARNVLGTISKNCFRNILALLP